MKAKMMLTTSGATATCGHCKTLLAHELYQFHVMGPDKAKWYLCASCIAVVLDRIQQANEDTVEILEEVWRAEGDR